MSLLPKSMQLQLSKPAPQDFSQKKVLKQELYSRVSFRSENYIASIAPSRDVLLQNEKFDTIVCLGVSKFIQLNFGDQGINALFLKAFHQLESSGTFILGPQQWSSYKGDKGLCPLFREMVTKVIALKPGLYLRYLTRIGFIHERTLESKEHGLVYILKKP